jgi:hypothetical protein
MWNRGIKSVTDVLPEELVDPSRLTDVIHYIQAAPLTSDDKVTLLLVWARNVGVKTSASQRAAVAKSGVDQR